MNVLVLTPLSWVGGGWPLSVGRTTKQVAFQTECTQEQRGFWGDIRPQTWGKMVANQRPRTDWIWLLGYLAVLCGVVYGVIAGQQWATKEFGTAAAQADWDRWREDVSSQADDSNPVKRRVPKSEQPPALVLVRDYFEVCLIGSIGLSSVLYWAFVFMLRGALNSPGPKILTEEEPSP